jgi:hypothetical protein
LLRRLGEDGHDYDIVGVSRRPPPLEGVYACADWHQVDLAEPGVGIQLHRIFRGAACVVHLAWGFQPTRNGSAGAVTRHGSVLMVPSVKSSV